MSKKFPHKIRTHKVEVEFENAKDVFEFKNHLLDVCRNRLLPALEDLFDEKIDKTRIVSFDHLMIDVGELPKEGWETELIRSVKEQLGQYIGQSLTGSSEKERRRGGREKDGIGAIDLKVDHSFPSESRSKEIEIRATGLQPDDILYFLEKGLLPWYVEIRNKEELQTKFLKFIHSGNGFRDGIFNLVKTRRDAFRRLILQFNDDCVYSVLTRDQQFISDTKVMSKGWVEIFHSLKISSSEQKILLCKAIMELQIRQNVPVSEFHVEVLKQLTKGQIQLLKKLVAKENVKQINLQVKKIFTQINPDLKKWSDATANEKEIDPVPKDVGKRKHDRAISDAEPHFINNAGLVILHPFLKNLFENVGYTIKNEWISGEVHERALLLSQYLVGGSGNFPEYDMFLNKILMGYPLEESFSSDLELSEFELKEADELLLAVIGHWSALKNTSISGLQTTFLQREGKLTKNDNGWLLQIEQKAFDLLLEKIPWGFATIKTPWMKEILNVEWA